MNEITNTLRDALQELVALKDLKERIKDGDLSTYGIADASTAQAMAEQYERRKPLAWEAARAALAAKPAEPTAFECDDGSSFVLTGYDGGASSRGLYGGVMCELHKTDGSVEVMSYVRANTGPPVAPAPAEPQRLWLWQNFVDGRPEYWAFDNPFPVHLDCGDPQTLGEPCGYALLKQSRVGRTDVSDEEVLRRIGAAAPAAVPAEPQPIAEDCSAVAPAEPVAMLLSELMRGLEIPPGTATSSRALYEIGRAIADQAKAAVAAPAPPQRQPLCMLTGTHVAAAGGDASGAAP